MSAQTKKRPAVKRPAPASKRSGSRWVFPAVLAAIVVVGVVAVAVVASGGDDSNGGGGTDAIEVAAEVGVDGSSLPRYSGPARDSAVGMAAPSLGSVDFEGNNVVAGGATGEPYALVFLAHYCPHCQAEVPRLVGLAQNGQIEGVDVIAVTTGTNPAAANYPPSEWLAREDWPFPVLVDDDNGTAADAYGLTAYPFLVFVDADGNVAGRISGEVSEEDLTKIFRALAAGDPVPLPGGGASSSSS